MNGQTTGRTVFFPNPCAKPLAAFLLLFVLCGCDKNSAPSTGASGAEADAPSVYDAGVSPVVSDDDPYEGDRHGSFVHCGGMTYFIAGGWGQSAIFRISRERGAVAEEIHRPQGEDFDVTWLAASGDRLYWIEGEWGHALWLMYSDDGFASTNRLTEVGHYANVIGVDRDAVYIENSFAEAGRVYETRFDRITNVGEISHLPDAGMKEDVSPIRVYRGYLYYTKDDPASSSEERERWFWRGLFRKPIDEIFAAGGHASVAEEAVAGDFVQVDDPGDGYKVTRRFFGGKVYFSTGEPYGDADETTVREVDLRTLNSTSAAIGAPWNVFYASDGALYYFDWRDGTVNGTRFGGGTETVMNIPKVDVYVSDIAVIDSWLYVSDAYSRSCSRIALDGSGVWETIYPLSYAKASLGDMSETEACIL